MNGSLVRAVLSACFPRYASRYSPWRLAWKLALATYLAGLALIAISRQVNAPSIFIHDPTSLPSYSFRQTTQFFFEQPAYENPALEPLTGLLPAVPGGSGLVSGLRTRLFLPALLTHSVSVADAGPDFNYEGIDFQDGGSRILIEISPPTRQVNGGKPLRISFLPGDQCEFGDKHACVFSYRTSAQANVIFLTVHSGVGGEGQKFRHAIEGTGIDQAGLKLGRVLDNLQALEGAAVSLHQSGKTASGLQIYGLSRIPPKKIHQYFSLPVEQALEYAAYFDETLVPAELSGQPLIILETCGWKMPGEPWAKDVTATTGSIYLAVIAPVLTP